MLEGDNCHTTGLRRRDVFGSCRLGRNNACWAKASHTFGVRVCRESGEETFCLLLQTKGFEEVC